MLCTRFAEGLRGSAADVRGGPDLVVLCFGKAEDAGPTAASAGERLFDGALGAASLAQLCGIRAAPCFVAIDSKATTTVLSGILQQGRCNQA